MCVQTAGPKTGISSVDKARKAVDSVKIILALNSISGILKVGASPAPACVHARPHVCMSELWSPMHL